MNLSLPLIAGCYFPTYDNRATWVRFKYEGIYRFCKKCGFVGHGQDTCAKEQDEVTFHLERRFRKLHESGARVLFGPTDVPLYSNTIRGVHPNPEIWSTELVFGEHDDENTSDYSGDSHPSDGDLFGPGNLESPSSRPMPTRSLPDLFPRVIPGTYRNEQDEVWRRNLGINRAIRTEFEAPAAREEPARMTRA